MTGVRIGVLLSLLLASPVSAQGAGGLLAPVPDAVEAVSGQVRERLYPDESVRELWVRVTRCAGEARDRSKTLEQVVFILRDSTYWQGALLKGEWVPPDTVYLTVGLENEGWIVAHELMHHALNGPPGLEKHPMEVFLRCRLFEFQQHTGGMMGGTIIADPAPGPGPFAR